MTMNKNGFTLIEILAVLAIISIIFFYAIPSMQDMIEKTRLKGAADKLLADFRYARSVAILNNKPVYVTFKINNAQWCYGISTKTNCDCNTVDACQVNHQDASTSAEDFRGISLEKAKFGTDNIAIFEPNRGTTQIQGLNNGTAWFISAQNKRIAVVVNRLGRVRSCSHDITGYSKLCPLPPS